MLHSPPDLSAIASAYVSHPTEVQCLTRGQFNVNVGVAAPGYQYMGHVVWDQVNDVPLADSEGRYTIQLLKPLCDFLEKPGAQASRNEWDTTSTKDMGYGPAADKLDGMAMSTFLHEMLHIKLRSSNESLVECTTYQNRWSVIKLFRPLARWVQLQIYWGMKLDHEDSAPNYRELC